MSRQLILAAAGSLVVCFCASSYADAPSEQEMADRVDARLAEVWAQEGIEPAPRADDAEFLRRAWLDLTGIIPPINDSDRKTGDDYGVRGFLEDQRKDKRQRLINYLLNKPTHATHFSNIWKSVMLPAESNVLRFGGDAGFQTWLRGQFADNVPYDETVKNLVLANGQANQVGPALFYTALELKPEELAASTSRIFLGTQIQCAQCHDHPFDHWTREDFWGYAAFFAQLQRPQAPQQVAFQVQDAELGEVMIPETEEIMLPKFLGEQSSPDDDNQNRRQRLAAWLTSADNPFFARATVNRVWALMFGRGVVDPVDDLGAHNLPSHPELLDDLAAYFAETGFDLNRLVRTLANTQAYQRSSRSTPGADDHPELFARMAIKSLTAEQLYDCLQEAMRKREPATVQRQGQFARGRFDQNKQAFLEKFRAPTQGATEYEAGIPQALTLMNGSIIREATDLGNSDLLGGLEAPFFSDEGRVEILFLSTLSRKPTKEEQAKLIAYVEKGGATNNRREALGDILWALLNSAEFVLNH